MDNDDSIYTYLKYNLYSIIMKKYNLYLHSKDKTNTKNNNATFDINWNFCLITINYLI